MKKLDKEIIMETEKVVTEDIMASSAEEVPVPEQGVPAPSEPPVEPPVPPEVPDEKSRKSFLRACASWTDIFVIAAMLSVLLMIFGELLTLILDRWVIHAPQIGMKLLGDGDSVEFLLQYFDFYGIWIAFMLVILLFKSNWPMWKAFLYNGHGNNLKAIPAGILLGFGMNGFCILMSVIMGDIKLSFNGFDPKLFFIFLFCVLIQSGAEEIIDRCYLYQKLRRRYRWPAIAVLVNALVFMSLHMGNPGVTKLGLLQVFLIGVLFSLIVYYWDSLWTVIWAHTAWNFSQSIVFGLPNSGIVSKYSVFKLEAASARDGIFYNTSFGVEGSMGANVMIAAAIVIVLIYGIATKRGERMDHWAEAEIRDAGKNHYWEAVVLTLIVAGLTAAGVFGAKWMNDHADEINQYFESQGIKPTESGELVQVLPSESGEPAQTQ
jgi:membrane protease YdiL (CAAX protease family)